MKIRKVISSVLLLVAFGLMTVSAFGASITGNLAVSGGSILNAQPGSATKVLGFVNPAVVQADGSFASYINSGDPVVMAPFTFNPSTAEPALIVVGGFQFDLSGSTVEFQNSSFVSISGTGVVSGNGFDPTPGVFNFSSQGPSANNVFSFSAGLGASSGPSGVPVNDVGGTSALLAGGTFLFFGIRRLVKR